MDEFIIEGGHALHGEATPSGNKNAALPLLALFADEPVTLRNVPQIWDVQAMRHLIESLGAVVEELDATTWRIHHSGACLLSPRP